MRVNQAPTSRAAYTDRNPSQKGVSAQALATGPHTLATRWTYTVPAARKALVNAAYGRWRRKTAAAPVGEVNNSVQIGTPAVTACDIRNTLNTVDAIESNAMGVGALLQAAETCNYFTLDPGTGGTCDYTGAMFATEFDA